ncbi:2Fe-2S iron-sulfur cluster-binding protein [Sodalis sp. RH21]|uniref:2Fe-2S iron-sulfur cluster-binding protein n=1 Tax=unclassified Sodalis (in: enterobacteria) TaxID=2636512 RepID=UPI0039B6DAB1
MIWQCKIRHHSSAFGLSEHDSILTSAHLAGKKLKYGCAAGHCGLCKLRLCSGQVDMRHSGGISRADITAGYILACCSRPLTDIEIELDE